MSEEIKYNFVFDGSLLANEFYKNSSRSGIFFVVKNIFNELLKRNDINLFIYTKMKKYVDVKKYLKINNLTHIEIINDCEYDFMEKLKEKSLKLKGSIDKKEYPIKRSLVSLLVTVLNLGTIIKNKIKSQKKFEKKLKNIDFFFSPCNEVPKIIKKQKHILSSVYLHDTIPLLFPEYFPKIGSAGYWFIKLINNLSTKELYFANSECTKNDFLKFIPKLNSEQIKTAYLGASELYKVSKDEKIIEIKNKYNIPQNSKYIFSLCTLDSRKNSVFAVKNFISFIEKNNIEDLYFVLGGSMLDSFLNALSTKVPNLEKYQSKIIKAGYIEDEELPYLYSNAFCFIYPSLYEGFGLPILEAMKCACPVITSNVSSIPEIVEDAGIQINPCSDEECIKAFETMYFDNDKRLEFSNLAIKQAEKFSWKNCTDIIVENLINYERKV